MSDRQSGEKMGGSEPASAGHGKAEGSGKSAEREGPDARDHERNRKSADSKEEIDRKSAETGSSDRRDRDRKAAEMGNNDRIDRERNRESAEGGDRDRDHDRKGGAVKMSSDQKQKVRTYFSEHRPTAKRIDKSEVHVSIGVGIPAGIALAPLPPDVVVVAANCPLQYFLWGDDVVLVDSCSREVVDIIPNMG
jgi:hypothetical protein